MRKYGIVAVTCRFAAPWNTRTRWSCFSDCEWVLVQEGKRHDDWNGGSGCSRRSNTALACGHEQRRQMRPGAEVHERSVRQVDWRVLCAQMGEAESVSQQEFSTSTRHGPRLPERAQMMLHAAMKTVSELIAHLDCRFRRKAFDAEECGDARLL